MKKYLRALGFKEGEQIRFNEDNTHRVVPSFNLLDTSVYTLHSFTIDGDKIFYSRSNSFGPLIAGEPVYEAVPEWFVYEKAKQISEKVLGEK